MQSLEPSYHPLFVSDLLHLVCDLLELSDWMSLMLTCKSMFATAASHIWASLDGVQVLTDLLVEATEAKSNSTSPTDAAVDFSRFDVYAPLVRRLRVYGRTSKYLRGEYRRRCALRSQQSSLFPKLESITMHTSDLCHDSDALMWIEILAAPTLTELRVIPIEKRGATALVSCSATAKISKLLLDMCPRIRKLELYPSDISDDGDETSVSDVLWQASLQQSFGPLIYLRKLTTGITLLEYGGLGVLGALPCLQELLIDGSLGRSRDLQLLIPGTSFPALFHLTLVQVDSTSLTALMGVLPLVRCLTSLSLSQKFGPRFTASWHHASLCRDWLSENLPLFLQNSPSLKRFSYDAGESSRYIGRSYYSILHISLLQAMSKLSLEYVSLSGLSFDLGFMHGIPNACPSLIELRMPESFVPNQDLHWLARLPKLRRLSVRLSFYDLPSNWDSFNGPLETLENTTSDIRELALIDAEQAAKFLLSMWPNLRQVEWPFRRHLQDNHGPQGITAVVKRHWRFIDDLNDAICDIRIREREPEQER